MDDDVCIAALPQLQQLVSACCLPVEISGSKELYCVAHTEKVNIYCDGCFYFLNVAPWFSSGSADPSADVPEKNGKTGMLGHFMLVCWLLWFFMLLFNVSSLPLMFYVDFPLAFTLIVCFNEGELLLKLLGFYVLVCWSSV
jgi:hypothetical protein